MSSDSNDHGGQCGPGPPYTRQQVMSPYITTDGAGMPRPHGSAPAVSPSVTDISSNLQGIPSAEQRAGGRPIAQPAFRMGGHPAGAGLVPASFQAVCGAGISASARTPIPTSGYYPYPSPVASLYPYSLMSHSAGPAPAVGGLSAGGAGQELIGTLNRSMALLRSPTPASPPTSMESAWGAQYTHVTGGSWPGVSMQAARRHPCFPTASPPAVASSTLTVRGGVSPVAAGGMPALPPIASASASPAKVTSAARTTASAAQKSTQPRSRAVLPSTAASSSGREQELSAPNGAASASTTSEPCAAGKETEDVSRRQQNKAGLEEGGGESRGEEDGEDEDDTMKGDGDFEADGTEKRRRLTAEERLQRSRERNQLHARKTRQRKKAQLQLLVNRSADLQAEQQRLRQAITDRRTASILLGMSGSDDVQGAGRQAGSCKASRDHPPALAEMSGRTPRAGMLSALESDDTGDGGGKGTGGNRSDDLGSETTAGTSCSASSGRTSSEANSSDGTVGGSGGSADGGDGVGAAADKLPKIGNPGDTERLLELSQKTRSECTPEELEQIRRERNRMHAKRTRDRKKLHLEATEGMIARLEQENRKLRDSMKAMGSVGSPSGVVVATSLASSSPSTSLKPEAGVPTGYAHAPPPAVPQAGSSLVHSVSPPPSQPPTVTPQQPYPGHQHPFLHHPTQRGPHMPQQQLHGGGVARHVYPQQHQHHLPHGTHQLVQQSLQQTPAAQQNPMGYYPYHYSLAVDARGSASGIGGGSIMSDTNGGGSRNGASALKKPEVNSYTPGGRLSSMGYMGTSNPPFPSPQVLAYQGSAAFSPPLGKTTSHMMAASSHAQQHVNRVPEPQGYKGWDVLGRAQAAHLPHSTYAHAHADERGRERSVIGNFPGGWDADAAGVGVGAGAISAPERLNLGTPGAGAATVAAYLTPQGSNGSQLSSPNRGGEPPRTHSNGTKTDAKIEGRRERNVASDGNISITSAVTSVHSVMSSSGNDNSRDKSKASSACGGGSTSSNKSGKCSPSGSKSSSSSAAGNDPARLFARARADQEAQAEKTVAGREPAAATAASQLPQIQTEQVKRRRDESSTQQAAASNDQSNKLDRDLSRGCQEAWQQIRRERSAKRKRAAAAAAAAAEEGPLRYYHRQNSSAGSDTSQSSCNSGVYSSSDCSNGDGGAGSSGEGSVGEGSVSSNFSSSSWGESEESSVLPASTTSSEGGRGRHEGSGSDGRSPPDGSSQSGSESGSEELGVEKGGANEGKRIAEMMADKVARRSPASRTNTRGAHKSGKEARGMR